MKFSDTPGHIEVKRALGRLAESGHVPHAVMISGPSGVGKMLMARTFAQLLHCSSPIDGEPCGRCANCRLHAENQHPDLHYVYPIVKSASPKRAVSADFNEEWQQMISQYPAMPEEKWLEIMEAGNSQPMIYVDEADEIVLRDAYPPFAADRKIFIIWLPERLRIEAANKLLKVIEEPSDTTSFILVSNNELQVLPTIYSRVQRFGAVRLSDAEVAQYLTDKYHLPPLQAEQYAKLCGGSLIRADEIGSNSGENEEFAAIYRDVMRAAYGKRVAKLRQIADSVAGFGREKIRRFLAYVSRMARENFIFNLRMPQLNALTPEEEAFSQRFSPFVNHNNIDDFMTETDRARRDIEGNANPKVVLFDYFLMIIILLHRKT